MGMCVWYCPYCEPDGKLHDVKSDPQLDGDRRIVDRSSVGGFDL